MIIGDRLMSREQINAFNRLRKPWSSYGTNQTR